MVVVWALVVSNGGFLVAPTSKSWWSVRDPLARRFSAMKDSRVDGTAGLAIYMSLPSLLISFLHAFLAGI